MSEERTTFLAPAILVVAISLSAASGTVLLLCRLLLRHSLTWMELMLIAAALVLAAVQIYGAVLWALARAGHDYVDAGPRELILGSWTVAAWLPALILLMRQHSIWIAALAPWLTAQIAGLLARLRYDPVYIDAYDGISAAVAGDSTELTLFQFNKPSAIFRNGAPVVATSVAWQCGIAAMAGGEPLVAALLFSSGVIFPCWYPARITRIQDGRLQPLRAFICLLVAVLAAALTLMPMARHYGAAMRASALLGVPEATMLPSERAVLQHSSHYSGIVLTLPPQHIHNLVAPPLNLFQHPNPTATPAVIPFDGVYWYYQPPDEKPGPDAYILRGDPIRVGVRATDDYPLTMEAHQSLAQPIRLDCCRAIRVDLRSMEFGSGGVYIGLSLRNSMSKVTYTLENQVLPSSVDAQLQQKPVFARAPTEESLSFPLPHTERGSQFNEIVVSIHLVRNTILTGAHVAVKQFALQR